MEFLTQQVFPTVAMFNVSSKLLPGTGIEPKGK
jgi:hypothetical protein